MRGSASRTHVRLRRIAAHRIAAPAGSADGVVPEGHLPHDGAAAGQRALEVRALVAHDLRAGPEARDSTEGDSSPSQNIPLQTAIKLRGVHSGSDGRGATARLHAVRGDGRARAARQGPTRGPPPTRPRSPPSARACGTTCARRNAKPHWRSRVGLDRSRADVAGAGPRGAGVGGGSEQRGVRAPRGSHLSLVCGGRAGTLGVPKVTLGAVAVPPGTNGRVLKSRGGRTGTRASPCR